MKVSDGDGKELHLVGYSIFKADEFTLTLESCPCHQSLKLTFEGESLVENLVVTFDGINNLDELGAAFARRIAHALGDPAEAAAIENELAKGNVR